MRISMRIVLRLMGETDGEQKLRYFIRPTKRMRRNLNS